MTLRSEGVGMIVNMNVWYELSVRACGSLVGASRLPRYLIRQ